MSVDQRIRQGLLATNTRLPEADPTQALDAVISRARATTRRHRWIAAGTAAAVAAAVVGVVVLAPRPGDDGPPSPVKAPTPSPSVDADAVRVVAEGRPTSYGMGESGSVLSVWTTCGDEKQCPVAWRLGAGAEPLAAGLLPESGGWNLPAVYPARGGFVLHADNDGPGWFVAQDGTITTLVQQDCSDEWRSAVDQPERYVIVPSSLLGAYLVDTVDRTNCSIFPSSEDDVGDGVYGENGVRWRMTSDSTVGWYDGARWRQHELPDIGSDHRLLAVSGPRAAVLQIADDSTAVAVSVTADGGGTWAETGSGELPSFRWYDDSTPGWTYISMAFAGTSALFVANADGGLWRSTDWTGFSRVETAGPVFGLEPAGDAVIAQMRNGNRAELVLITGDGTVQPLVVR